VDLRGNTGGGIGGLGLMSYLTPGKTEVGYSLTRARKEKGYARENYQDLVEYPHAKPLFYGWLCGTVSSTSRFSLSRKVSAQRDFMAGR